jgi:hypothetical protein
MVLNQPDLGFFRGFHLQNMGDSTSKTWMEQVKQQKFSQKPWIQRGKMGTSWDLQLICDSEVGLVH